MISSYLMYVQVMSRRILLTLLTCFVCVTTYAAQTGNITGKVTNAGGGGVTVTASSTVLPQPRNVNTAANGRYKFALLPPGDYQLVFKADNGNQTLRNVIVQLDKTAKINVALSASTSEMESVTVYGSSSAADLATASLKSSIGGELIEALPVGQQYRDMIKLIPGVQYSEDTIRGPSAGGSGQDNVYQFDGVDISKPLFGTLGAEPSTHDIDQVSVVKGGAAAVGFNRSGGFTVNTISKAGSNEFKGEVSYQLQPGGFTVKQKDSSALEFDEDKTWLSANIGGPVIQDRLFFYASYYGPTVQRDNSSSAYGDINDFTNDRDEYFGKLTYAPIENMLLHLSHRTSDRETSHGSVGGFNSASTSTGSRAKLDITIAEGNLLLGDNLSISFKYTDYEEETGDGPDTRFDFNPGIDSSLDITALDQQGRFSVPKPVNGATAYNAFIAPLVAQYGFQRDGSATGGGTVGGASTINDFLFTRESFEIGVDLTLYWGNATHDLHLGYRQAESGEVLARLSNGWGSITVPGGRTSEVFYEARIQQMSLGGAAGTNVPEISSGLETRSIEINDTIEWGDLTFNLGVLWSNDALYGQGLAKSSNSMSVSGFEQALGHRYKMHEDGFSDMIQPRLGVTWDWTDATSVFANYALYHPAATSLPRAASWGRNLRREIKVRFDAAGEILEIAPVRSSSGKIFQAGIDPREIEEFIIGMTHEFDHGISGRVHLRHRKGENFWEDTPNTGRLQSDAPDNIPHRLYVENLGHPSIPGTIRAEIGGSSYVIALLDRAYTKYWEASFEGEWSHNNWFFRGSYVWSHYYGNFDQDNSTTNNDANVFIGSSLIADGAGRQLWNNRDGDLRGDRRHMLKLYGFYELPWQARVGAYVIAQSGQPWEAWDSNVYRALTRSTSDTGRYAEPAGSRRSSSHWQVDFNYTQNIAIWNDLNLQLRADLYNLFDKQTGYNINTKVNSAGFGQPRSNFNPRRLQLAVKLQF